MKIKTIRLQRHPGQVPSHAPTDYCPKLEQGISRLRRNLLQRYEQAFPEGREEIRHAVARAEAAAWTTPFPALFLSTLIHLQIAQIYPSMVVNSPSSFQS